MLKDQIIECIESGNDKEEMAEKIIDLIGAEQGEDDTFSVYKVQRNEVDDLEIGDFLGKDVMIDNCIDVIFDNCVGNVLEKLETEHIETENVYREYLESFMSSVLDNAIEDMLLDIINDEREEIKRFPKDQLESMLFFDQAYHDLVSMYFKIRNAAVSTSLAIPIETFGTYEEVMKTANELAENVRECNKKTAKVYLSFIKADMEYAFGISEKMKDENI